tara:strand:- start:1819 stop:2052 length:234 start_codon:yes stop_codon:yes gene_type:complete
MYWLFLVIVALAGCTGPKEGRGDWMEHLNAKQFDSEPPMSHVYRRNYRSMEELREMWKTTYEQAIADLDKVIQENSE